MTSLEQQTRQLGAALQQDPAWIRYREAQAAAVADTELQALLSEFETAQLRYTQYARRLTAEQDPETLASLEQRAVELYETIRTHHTMAELDMAQEAWQQVYQNTFGILEACADGEDPETCAPKEVQSCASCGGCG